jgi:hypothetical protein
MFVTGVQTCALPIYTEFNWLSLNLPQVYKAHIGHGAGDYVTGTLMFHALLTAFGRKVDENKTLTVDEIERIIKEAYNKSPIKKFKF